MCLGDFVSGLPPLSLFHFLARRPLPARLIAKSLCPCSNRAHSNRTRTPPLQATPAGGASTSWGQRVPEGVSVRRLVPVKSARHGGGTRPPARSQPTPGPPCPPGGRRFHPPA